MDAKIIYEKKGSQASVVLKGNSTQILAGVNDVILEIARVMNVQPAHRLTKLILEAQIITEMKRKENL